MMVMPLDDALGIALGEESKAWISMRLLKGDPGPLYVQNGQMWTEMSEAEDVTAKLGVEVRVATEDEQREALERHLVARGLVVSEPVTGSTVELRTASEARPSEGPALVLRRGEER